jgi:hypothetical protein
MAIFAIVAIIAVCSSQSCKRPAMFKANDLLTVSSASNKPATAPSLKIGSFFSSAITSAFTEDYETAASSNDPETTDLACAQVAASVMHISGASYQNQLVTVYLEKPENGPAAATLGEIEVQQGSDEGRVKVPFGYFDNILCNKKARKCTLALKEGIKRSSASAGLSTWSWTCSKKTASGSTSATTTGSWP